MRLEEVARVCAIQPPPLLGVALPWQAPQQWTLFLFWLTVLSVLYWGIPGGLLRQWPAIGRGERTLWIAATLFGAMLGVLGFLVLDPTSQALDVWMNAASQAPGCSFDEWFIPWSRSLDGITRATNILIAIGLTFIVLLAWAYLLRRKARHQAAY